MKPFPLAHARCGTSFLLTLIVISIIIFSLLGQMPLWQRIISRILMVPIIAMFSYEIIKWMGDNSENPFVKAVSYPNLLLQKLTPPNANAALLALAIPALNKLIELESA